MKFGYLLELVNPKVRGRLSNSKPGSEGYKTAWERMKMEYGHNKLVIAANMEEIISCTRRKEEITIRYVNFMKVFAKVMTHCKRWVKKLC